MRWALLSLLVCLPTGAYSQVYRWVDADGQTHYSDRPSTGSDAFRIQAPPEPTQSGSESVALPQPGLALLGPYQNLEILSPETNQTLRQDPGSLAVSLLLDPPLLPGHRLELLVDGVPITSKEPIGTQLTLSGLSVGTHVAQAQILDAAGTVARSAPITFHLRKPLPPGVLP